MEGRGAGGRPQYPFPETAGQLKQERNKAEAEEGALQYGERREAIDAEHRGLPPVSRQASEFSGDRLDFNLTSSERMEEAGGFSIGGHRAVFVGAEVIDRATGEREFHAADGTITPLPMQAVKDHTLQPKESWWSKAIRQGRWDVTFEYHMDHVLGGLTVEVVGPDFNGPKTLTTLFPEDQKKAPHTVRVFAAYGFNVVVRNDSTNPATLESVTFEEVVSETHGGGVGGAAAAEATRASGDLQQSAR